MALTIPPKAGRGPSPAGVLPLRGGTPLSSGFGKANPPGGFAASPLYTRGLIRSRLCGKSTKNPPFGGFFRIFLKKYYKTYFSL